MSSEVAVSNSSPLIYLAKLNRLNLLKSLYGHVTVPYGVYNEVVRRGKEESHAEAKIIEQAFTDGWLRVSKVEQDSKLPIITELDAGELEVLHLAKRIRASIVIIDDASARLAAEALGFNSKGTIYIILRAAKENFISKSEARRLLTELISAGFWISSEVLGRILSELE